MAQETKFIIEEKLAQDILRYLISKPFSEVHQLIPALQAMKPVPLPELIEKDRGEDKPKSLLKKK